jgi:signal transduction histidine kinase/HPt (histidine-containing phosphotransfer) domain-containing protein/ActR/RegA family two-component response regulator
MIILTVYSAMQIININRAYDNLTESTSRQYGYLSDALETLALLRLNNVSIAYQINEDEIAQLYSSLHHHDYETMCDQFLGCLRDYRANVIGDTSMTENELYLRLRNIASIESSFINRFISVLSRIRVGVNSRDKSHVRDELEISFYSATEMTSQLDFLRKITVEYIETESERITNYSKRIALTQYLVAIAIIIVSFFLSLFMSSLLVIPLHRLENAAAEIARGNLSYPIRDASKDEIGSLSNRIGDMVDSLENATNAKTAFLANMSHEMRTPLNVIVGLTTLQLDNENIAGEIKTDLKKINRAGELLLGIVNDVLDISKIEAGRLEMIPVEYYTASLLNDIITINMIRIESKMITFNLDISENLPTRLIGDELRIKQIYNNLLSNAFKYTREGSVTLRVSCERISDENVWVTAKVSDTGIGIKNEDIEKLFSEYNQVDMKANRRIEGTGLGLSITKKLVILMDGEITVESEYGMGTTFSIKYKQSIADEKPIGWDIAENLRSFRYTDQKQLISSSVVRPDLSYAKVLVVDDFPTNLDVAAGMLRKYKMQVDSVLSGREAVNLIKKGEPVYSAIFMDHMMPEMDGIEATRLIREIETEYARTIPIIALTANAVVGNEQMFLDNGFNAFLSKPINILMLDIIVKKWIRNKDNAGEITEVPIEQPKKKSEMQMSDIPGVDINTGLDLCGGDMDIFIFALESFIKHTPESINRLRYVTAENLQNYATAVHGLKGVCAAIGAEAARAKAFDLEKAAKAGDLDTVLAENDGFLRDTEILLDNIRNWLEKRI